jgi:hypothetical protein
MKYKLSYVRGHVEVYDESGNFLFSADNHREAMDEIKTRQAAYMIGEKDPAA